MVSRKSITLICCYCQKSFHVFPSRKPQGTRVFCSWEHRHAAAADPRIITLRFWDKVLMCSHGSLCTDCCWLWEGATTQDGYGKFYSGLRDGKPHWIRAHRFAWFLVYGRLPDPDGCHNCPSGDNPLCVNYSHLWEGDHAANNADAARKGRTAIGDRNGARLHGDTVPRGVTHYRAQFTESQIQTVHDLFSQGWTQRAIGLHLSMHYKQVWKIVHLQAWAHIAQRENLCHAQ